MPNRTPPKSPSTPPSEPGPTGQFPGLRLRRDDGPENCAGGEGTGSGAGAVSYKFPRAGEGGRVRATRGGRLVAAQVAEAPVERSFDGSPCAVLSGGDDPDCLGRIVSSRQLVKEIEGTLDRMQSRLTDFRTELDRAFKFPISDDDDLPPAA